VLRGCTERQHALSSLSGNRVLYFDINETTLDLAPAEEVINSLVGPDGYQLWFDRLIQMSMVCSHTGHYDGFGALAASSLSAICESRGVEAGGQEWGRLKAALDGVQGHADVTPGLDALKKQGFSLVAFSNSPLQGLEAQLKQAGLYEKYDAVVSVDGVKAGHIQHIQGLRGAWGLICLPAPPFGK